MEFSHDGDFSKSINLFNKVLPYPIQGMIQETIDIFEKTGVSVNTIFADYFDESGFYNIL